MQLRSMNCVRAALSHTYRTRSRDKQIGILELKKEKGMLTLTKPPATEKAVFHWDDPLRLDLQLTDVERDVQQNAFKYAQEALLPRVLEAHRTENYQDIP